MLDRNKLDSSYVFRVETLLHELLSLTILLHGVVTSSCIWNWNTRPTQRQTLDEEPNYCRSPVNCRGGNRFPLSTVAKGHSSFMFFCSIYWWRYTQMLHFWLCPWLMPSSFVVWFWIKVPFYISFSTSPFTYPYN